MNINWFCLPPIVLFCINQVFISFTKSNNVAVGQFSLTVKYIDCIKNIEHMAHVRQAKLCLRVCKVFFLGVPPFWPHLQIGLSHIRGIFFNSCHRLNFSLTSICTRAKRLGNYRGVLCDIEITQQF